MRDAVSENFSTALREFLNSYVLVSSCYLVFITFIVRCYV